MKIEFSKLKKHIRYPPLILYNFDSSNFSFEMNYKEAVEWLFVQLPVFQHSGSSAYRADIGNITELCDRLGNPQENYKTVHVAGTNGKGSSCHMMASILQQSGYKTGLYTSPHLKDFRERIRVNGQLCSEEFVTDFVNLNFEFIKSLNASFFEVTTAMAFEYFSRSKVDVAVIETGLGGRLDSTNIIRPVLSVITNIGLDHTAILGDTLAKIAFEKAGIIKKGIPAVIGETTDDTCPVFVKKSKETHSELIFAEELNYPEYESDLKGIYQSKNKRAVLAAVDQLRKLGFEISEDSVRKGLLNVVSNTGLRGRWEILNQKPLTVADTAHNPHGLAEIKKQIESVNYKKLHLVLGFVSDKDVKSILNFFPKDAVYYFCQPNVSRKFKIEELQKIIPKKLNANYYKSVKEALDAARSNSAKDDLIYIGGSTYVVAEIL